MDTFRFKTFCLLFLCLLCVLFVSCSDGKWKKPSSDISCIVYDLNGNPHFLESYFRLSDNEYIEHNDGIISNIGNATLFNGKTFKSENNSGVQFEDTYYLNSSNLVEKVDCIMLNHSRGTTKSTYHCSYSFDNHLKKVEGTFMDAKGKISSKLYWEYSWEGDNLVSIKKGGMMYADNFYFNENTPSLEENDQYTYDTTIENPVLSLFLNVFDIPADRDDLSLFGYFGKGPKNIPTKMIHFENGKETRNSQFNIQFDDRGLLKQIEESSSVFNDKNIYSFNYND